jgi:hypothetical protein
MDIPSDDPKHKDIPDWLYEELVTAEGTDQAGTWYAKGSSGSGFSPNYASPVLIQAHERFIKAIAAKFDRDPNIAFVQIGSLGHYGEFHSSLIDWFPSVEVSDQYVRHYIDHLQAKKMAMRKPFPLAARNGLGLYNDMFGETGATDTWLRWIHEGWYGIRDYANPNEDPVGLQRQSQMPDFWKSSYSGGEFSSNRKVTEYISDDMMLDMLDMIRQSHASWIGATSLAGLANGEGLSSLEQANADLLLSSMGYKFVLESVKTWKTLLPGKAFDIDMIWNNKGVAPFYYDWKLRLALVDAKGNVAASTPTTVQTDLRQWLPGQHKISASLQVRSCYYRS